METPTRTNTKNNKKNDVVTIQRTTFRELVAALLRAEAIGVLAALLDAIRKASWSLRITEVDGSFTNIKTTKELRIQLKQQARRLGTKTVIRKLTASNKQIKS